MAGVGGKLATGILLLALGAFAGAVLTLVHQATVQVGDATVPWGVIVALALTAALLAGLRIVSATRIPALSAALGLLVVNALLALPTAGGSVLVQANGQGYAWTFGPVLIAVVVLGWPRLPPRLAAQQQQQPPRPTQQGGDRMDGENPKGDDSP